MQQDLDYIVEIKEDIENFKKNFENIKTEQLIVWCDYVDGNQDSVEIKLYSIMLNLLKKCIAENKLTYKPYASFNCDMDYYCSCNEEGIDLLYLNGEYIVKNIEFIEFKDKELSYCNRIDLVLDNNGEDITWREIHYCFESIYFKKKDENNFEIQLGYNENSYFDSEQIVFCVPLETIDIILKEVNKAIGYYML